MPGGSGPVPGGSFGGNAAADKDGFNADFGGSVNDKEGGNADFGGEAAADKEGGFNADFGAGAESDIFD